MIILDMNQITLANVMMNFHMNKSDELEEDMVRHMILNSIRMYRTMFKAVSYTHLRAHET